MRGRRFKPGTWFAAVLAAAVVTGSARGATFCQKKSGVVTLRPTACAKKETAIDLRALGVTGPAGDKGATGPTGGVRAFAHVAANSTTLLASRAIASVTHPAVGIYCLVPDASVDASTSVAVVTPDAGHSTSTSLVAWTQVPPSTCNGDAFEVQTLDLNGAASNAVGFVMAVP